MVFVGRIYEELMKDFSQDQMKANPPNTSVDTGRKESLTKKKEYRAFLLNLLDCQNQGTLSWIWRFKLAEKQLKSNSAY